MSDLGLFVQRKKMKTSKFFIKNIQKWNSSHYAQKENIGNLPYLIALADKSPSKKEEVLTPEEWMQFYCKSGEELETLVSISTDTSLYGRTISYLETVAREFMAQYIIEEDLKKFDEEKLFKNFLIFVIVVTIDKEYENYLMKKNFLDNLKLHYPSLDFLKTKPSAVLDMGVDIVAVKKGTKEIRAAFTVRSKEWNLQRISKQKPAFPEALNILEGHERFLNNHEIRPQFIGVTEAGIPTTPIRGIK